MPPHIQRPSPARWRLVNMWGHPFYQRIISVVTWVPPHIHMPWIFRCLRPGPHLFSCSSMHWTTVFCIELTMDIGNSWFTRPSGQSMKMLTSTLLTGRLCHRKLPTDGWSNCQRKVCSNNWANRRPWPGSRTAPPAGQGMHFSGSRTGTRGPRASLQVQSCNDLF